MIVLKRGIEGCGGRALFRYLGLLPSFTLVDADTQTRGAVAFTLSNAS